MRTNSCRTYMNLQGAPDCDSTHFEGSTSSRFILIHLLSLSEAALTVDQRSVLHFAAESGAAVATAVLLGKAAREFGATVVSQGGLQCCENEIYIYFSP